MPLSNSPQHRAVWQERLKRFSRSGLSIAEFCRREHLSQPSFFLWRKRLHSSTLPQPVLTDTGSRPGSAASTAESRKNSRSSSPPSSFVELLPPCSAGQAIVEIELPNGARVRLPEPRPELLVAAIQAAAQLPHSSHTEEHPC
jgi:hypothetical protein